MAGKRERELIEKRLEADKREWETFAAALEKANTFADAKVLTTRTPQEGRPGRHFYSNLAFFLQDFTVPGSADVAEKALYIRLMKRMDESGSLKPGVMDGVVNALRASS